MFATERKSLAVPVAILAVAVMLCGAFIVMSDQADAVHTADDLTGQGYGEKYEISIAPGYTYTYTPEFDEMFLNEITISLPVNDFGTQIADVDAGTVTVTIPSGAETGTYNVVIAAEHEKSGQTIENSKAAYQWIQFIVTSGLSVSGTIENMVADGEDNVVDFTPQYSGNIGDVTWAVKDNSTDGTGLTFDGSKLTGTATVGQHTIVLTATDTPTTGSSGAGQTADLTLTFTVYNEIVGDNAETITSFGTEVSSRPISQTGSDLNVTWAVTGETQLPSGFELDPATGVVSGSSTTLQSVNVTITGTTGEGITPAQTTSKTIAVRSEPALVLTAEDTLLTYYNNSNAVSVNVGFTEGTSTITWSDDNAEATVANGVVSVTAPQTTGMSQTIVVTAQTEYGQTKTANVTYSVEETLSVAITEIEIITFVGNTVDTSAIQVSGGSNNNPNVSIETEGKLTANVVEGAVKVTGSEKTDTGSVTVTVTYTSAAGQTAQDTFEVTVYPALAFDKLPTTGAVVFALPVGPQE